MAAEVDLEREQHESAATASGDSSTRDLASPTQERGIIAVRTEAAVVRALVEELDQLLPGPQTDTLRSQVAEELERLSDRLLEVAGQISTRTQALT